MCNCKDKNTLADEYSLKRTPHVHADVIKAWADGKTIQVSFDGACWHDIEGYNPITFNRHDMYRVKPEPKPLTDLEKYGVEVGDVWWAGEFGSWTVTVKAVVNPLSFRAMDGSKYRTAQLHTLLFRRGVVNKL